MDRPELLKRKRRKKQHQPNKIIILILIFGVFFGLYVLSSYFNNLPHNYCKTNPDKCVCEGGSQWYTCGGVDGRCNIPSSCDKFRKKTPAELDIDDCNNAPSEKCKCSHMQLYIKPNEINLPDRNQCSGDAEACFRDGYTLPIPCQKFLPKTECEKGNPNYIEKLVDFEAIDTSVTPHKECILLDNSCVSAVRECREKTEVEKLMDKDCDELFNSVISKCDINVFLAFYPKKERDCSNYKQAWRQKRCSI